MLGRLEEAAPFYRRFIAVAPPSMDLRRISVFWDYQGSTVGHPGRTGGELIGGVPNFVDGEFAGPAPFDKAFRVYAK